jgi:hypothetical protein
MTVEQEANADGRPWCEVNRLANSKMGWKHFTATLCFAAKRERKKRKDDDDDDDDDNDEDDDDNNDDYVNIR